MCAALLWMGCGPEPTGAIAQPVVYETDGRTEVFAHPSAVLRSVAAESVAMKIDPDNLDESGAVVGIDYTRTLAEAQSLCEGVAFREQLEPGTCSGTLIDDRYLLTAGHCMDTPSDCSESVWIFGWRYVADGALVDLGADDVYRCARVLAYFDDDRVDHAIVELDRPVVGHTPATVRLLPSGLADGTALALIGHPNGIPMKIDTTGEVTWTSGDASWLTASVDAFNGNSGSGVFDLEGNLVALLRGGETDYVDAGGCNVINVIDPPPEDDGEGLTYVRPALEALCATPGVDSELCGCDGPCVEPLLGDRCEAAETLDAVDQTVSGTLVGYGPDAMGSCGGLGPDRVFQFTLSSTTRFVARSRGFDSLLYLREGCDGREVDCHDDIDVDTDRGSRITATLPTGTYHLFLDAYDSDIDPFELELTFDAVGDADAGPGTDAGTDPDAGRSADGGTLDAGVVDAGTGLADGGCSCRTQSSSGSPLPVLGFAALLWLRRRT